MKKLFWEDPYATCNETVLETVNGRDVNLRESVLYAFSGGQESDAGTINDIPVHRAEKSSRSILYFAAEIVLWLFMQTFPGVEKIGAHISQTKARLDFSLPQSIKGVLPSIQADAEELIRIGVPITGAFSDEEKERRYWEVPGFGSLPCGGTHPRSTGEIGPIRLARNNIGKGKERVEISLVK